MAADKKRSDLVREIRRSLLELSPKELFQIAKDVCPVPGEDSSKLDCGDVVGCFDHIHEFMYSKHLLESADAGMIELLLLKDAIAKVMQSHCKGYLPVDLNVTEEPELTEVASHPSGLVQSATANAHTTGSVNVTADVLVNTESVSYTHLRAHET